MCIVILGRVHILWKPCWILNVLNGAKRLLSEKKIKIIYTEICDTKENFLKKEKSIFDLLSSYNFELKSKYPIKSFSILSGVMGTDNLFVIKK